MTKEKPKSNATKPDVTQSMVNRPAKREKVLSGQPEEHIQQLLLDGEEILRVATIHPGIFWKPIAVLILALILLVVAFNLGVLMLIVSAIMFAVAALTKHFLLLALTNKRILVRYGIIQLDVVQIHLRKVESVELAWTIMGQILGYASVMVTGTGSRVSIVPYIANAPQFRKELENILMKIDDRILGGPITDGPVTGPPRHED